MDFSRKLTVIANENIQDALSLTARNIRDKMIHDIFGELTLPERFELSNGFERDHMERLIEQAYPGRFNAEIMPQVIDQLLASTTRQTEVLSASRQPKMVRDSSTPFGANKLP